MIKYFEIWTLSWIMGGPNIITNLFKEERRRVRVRDVYETMQKDGSRRMEAEGREEQRCYAAGFEDGARGHKPRSAAGLQKF